MTDNETNPSDLIPAATAPVSPAAPAVQPAPKSPGSESPKWETVARKRLSDYVKSHLTNLAKMKKDDANEATVRLIITDLLNRGFGYDLVSELAPEYMVRGEFADYGIRVETDLVAFLEVKRPSTKLTINHLKQVQSYAVNEGVEWLWLTNGAVWQVWHLTGGLPVSLDLVFELDLLDETTYSKKMESLFLLTRESMKRNQIANVWAQRAAVSPENVRVALLSDEVVGSARKQLRKTTGYNASVEEITNAIIALVN